MSYVFREGRGNEAVICMRCGFKRHANELRREWTGLRVCAECWDPRHPQMELRGVRDDQRIPGGPSPEPAETFVEPEAQTGDTL
jgi:hypothetical protein